MRMFWRKLRSNASSQVYAIDRKQLTSIIPLLSLFSSLRASLPAKALAVAGADEHYGPTLASFAV
jgi:hypothetical protein